jgi:serine/threonine-protein kinase
LRGAADLELQARFARELEVARRLGPPHFSQLIAGTATANGPCFIVWSDVSGTLLPDWCEQFQPPWAARLGVVADLLRALGDLHALGIIHRDLKPEHVLVTETGGVCLLDLGLCRIEGGDRLTSSRHVLGSAAFTAPEQINTPHRADARADLYAVGVIAFWLISGRLPISAPNPQALIALKLLRDPSPLSEVCEWDVPADLDQWVSAMLAREPARRPATANDALEWLGRVERVSA